MIVVADSSPLIVLVEIGHIGVLPALFGEIIIPPTVAQELRGPRRTTTVLEYFAVHPPWLRICPPAQLRPIEDLHAGEVEALNLASELHADLVLVDERKAYRAAVAMKLNAIGTVRVLERAADAGLIELKDVFERLKRTDFWISHKLLDERLALFQRGRSP
mgnify:CR=1 FL=1